ncbi:hypothetical protein EJB05_26211, partial [Eragrostis curvula]
MEASTRKGPTLEALQFSHCSATAAMTLTVAEERDATGDARMKWRTKMIQMPATAEAVISSSIMEVVRACRGATSSPMLLSHGAQQMFSTRICTKTRFNRFHLSLIH